MEYVYAVLLLHRAGKEITEEAIKKVAEAAGLKSNESKIKSLIASLKGVDIAKELETATIAVAVPAASAEREAKAEKKEEKKEEAAEGLSALFG